MRRPRFIAEQARHARGPIGRLVASIMASETRAHNERAIAALDVADGDHVIDVGCGPGRGLAALAARTRCGTVVGADPSELMAEIATGRNRDLVRKKRAKVLIAGADSLPFPDKTFDKALCVHVLYFWKDLRANFKEIGRILKPGGRLALLFRSTLDQAAVSAFPPEVYHFRDLTVVRAALEAEGFAVTERDSPPDKTARHPAPHLLIATRCS